MTLNETTLAVLAAAEAGDLDALEAAHAQREKAIAALAGIEPSEALRDAVKESLRAGEAATQSIRRIRQQARRESLRLATIESGFHSRHPQPRRIDCTG